MVLLRSCLLCNRHICFPEIGKRVACEGIAMFIAAIAAVSVSEKGITGRRELDGSLVKQGKADVGMKIYIKHKIFSKFTGFYNFSSIQFKT